MMSLEEDTRIGNVEEHENLRPRKAILQTQIDVEKVSKGSQTGWVSSETSDQFASLSALFKKE